VGEERGFADEHPEIQNILKAMNWEARLEAARVLRKAALAKRILERNAVEPVEELPVTAEISQITGAEWRVDSEAETEEDLCEGPRALKGLSGEERLEEALARRKEVLSQQTVGQNSLESAEPRISGSDACQNSEHESINHDRGNHSMLGAKEKPALQPLRVEPASFSNSFRAPKNGLVETNHRANGVASRLALGSGIGLGIGMSIILGVSILDIGPKLLTTGVSVQTLGGAQANAEASLQETNVLNSFSTGQSGALFSSNKKASLGPSPKVSISNPPPLSHIVILSTQIQPRRISQPEGNVTQPAPILQPPAVRDAEPYVQVAFLRPSYLRQTPELAPQVSGKENSQPRPMAPATLVKAVRAVPILDLDFPSETERDIASLAIAVPLASPDTRISGADAFEAVIYAPSTLAEKEVNIVAADLRETGIYLGRVNRVNYKVSTKQVRFFYQEDAELALALAQRIGAQARDFTNYRPSPPGGSIEIFLAGKGKRVVRRTPHRTQFVSDAIRLRNKIVRTLGIPER
jgi:hypothetical protein